MKICGTVRWPVRTESWMRASLSPETSTSSYGTFFCCSRRLARAQYGQKGVV
jgi:hypothetical protein